MKQVPRSTNAAALPVHLASEPAGEDSYDDICAWPGVVVLNAETLEPVGPHPAESQCACLCTNCRPPR